MNLVWPTKKRICMNKAIILSAPSGAGKSTLAKCLLERFPNLRLSVSATSRAPRGAEQHGKEYYFLTQSAFEEKIGQEAFVEWEEVYPDACYGTLKSELEQIWNEGNSILFDVDVKGGVRLKQIFGERACAIFIRPPSLAVLQERLLARGTDTFESIQKRISKAQEELEYASKYDEIIVNEDLEEAKKHIEATVASFLTPRRCGLYFGSFNPLHTGHLAVANYMLEFTDLDELRLVLSPENPLKAPRDMLDPQERLQRINRAVDQCGLPLLVSTVEFDLPQPCYTIHTLRHIAAQEPHLRFVLIMGADNLAVIEEWHQWQELLQTFEVYVYPRSGYDGRGLCNIYGATYIEAPLIDISATFIRRGWAQGRNMNGFLAGL